jgi:hydroxypyruvate isomerase
MSRQVALSISAVGAASAVVLSLFALPATAAPHDAAASHGTAAPRSTHPTPPPTTPTPTGTGTYYTGDYKLSLNLYSFNVNLNALVKNRKGAPPLDPIDAITWAKKAGFDAVDVPMYYMPGYSGTTMPTESTATIKAYVDKVRATAQEEGLAVTESGYGNDFAVPDAKARALEVQRAHFWIDMAAEMGAPTFRVFSGVVPDDLKAAGGWEAVAKARVVPALQDITAYAATKGVRIVLQNHGDMTATAAQTLQIADWVGNPNLSLDDDTGYFRPFQATTGLNYDWYSDINALLPRSADIQAKLKPAGADQAPTMNFNKLITGLRQSPYRGYIGLERLWGKTDSDNPKTQKTPPYDEVAAFLADVKKALAATKSGPAS